MQVISKPVKQRPDKNISNFNIKNDGAIPQKAVNTPPSKRETWRIVLRPKYSVNIGNISPENMAPY